MGLRAVIADHPEWMPRTAEQAAADWAAKVEAGILKNDRVVCIFCEGSGKRERTVRRRGGARLLTEVTCDQCDGSGRR